jgi:hypothetical protein
MTNPIAAQSKVFLISINPGEPTSRLGVSVQFDDKAARASHTSSFHGDRFDGLERISVKLPTVDGGSSWVPLSWKGSRSGQDGHEAYLNSAGFDVARLGAGPVEVRAETNAGTLQLPPATVARQ